MEQGLFLTYLNLNCDCKRIKIRVYWRKGESEAECCVREIAEETGVKVEISHCLLEIDEYYENCKWVNKYFICKAIGTTEIKQTKREMEVGMEPRWHSISKIKDIFSKHNSYEGIDEMRKGMYLREYTALMELI